MEKNRKHKDEYSIRTLSYYQRLGGVYNEIITILQRIRNSKDGYTLLAPNKILNNASIMFDCINLFCKDAYTREIDIVAFENEITEFWQTQLKKEQNNKEYSKVNKEVILCTLSVLLTRTTSFHSLFESHIRPLVSHNIYLFFKNSIGNQKISSTTKEMEEPKIQEDLIKQKDEELARLSNQIAEQQKTIISLKQQLATINNERSQTSRFDNMLTLETILEWIQGRQHYQYTEHVFRMLADLRYRVATDEECDRIKTVEDEMLSKNVGHNIINNNIGLGSNFMTGIAHHPLMPIGMTPEEMMNKFIEFMNYGTREGNQN